MNVLQLETQGAEAVLADELIYCPQHPTVATQMRCNKCGKLICLKCAVQTPVGYRCRTCVYQQQNVYFNAKGHDDLLAFVIALGLALVSTPIVAIIADSFYFGAFYLAFLGGPGAGAILVQLIRAAVGRRRSRYTGYFVLGGLMTGVLVGIGVALLGAGLLVLTNLPMWIFVGMAATTAYRMLRV
ncbi:MAG: B-box zinc finger protein [Caldilineaceae bacterium]